MNTAFKRKSHNVAAAPVDAPAQEIDVAEAYLAMLAARGIDYIFGNAGTDFPPFIEAYAKAKVHHRKYPIPFLVPHENVAVAMAHGYTMATGKMQAVMLHVGLGTANGLNGIVNASRQGVPMFIAAGRTPITERGAKGARSNYINWAQESFDQATMVREFVKWDYELRHPVQLETVIDRAFAIAQSEPQGPVYLTLPREVLAETVDGAGFGAKPLAVPATAPQADRAAIERLAAWIAAAEMPMIVTANTGRTAESSSAMARLVESAVIPVVQYRPRYMALPTDHPMQCGYAPEPLLPESDLILVVDCDVPWLPELAGPKPGVKVAHIGVDPLFARYPIRGFQSDLAITGAITTALDALRVALGTHGRAMDAAIVRRRPRVAKLREKLAPRPQAKPAKAPAAMTPRWISACVQHAKDDDTVVINEYPLVLEELSFAKPLTYFSHSPAGGLGWAMGAALGVKLAKPKATVIVTLGDGTYMFGNPTPTHFVSRAADLPLLYVIFNNARWAAVHRSTISMYPGGFAERDNQPAFTCLEPVPDYEKIVEACGGYGEKVTDPSELPKALERALNCVRNERRQAVLNVICEAVYVRTS